MGIFDYRRGKGAPPPPRTSELPEDRERFTDAESTHLARWQMIQPSRSRPQARKATRVDRGVEIDQPNALRNRIVKITIIVASLIAVIVLIREWTGQRGSDRIVAPGANRGSHPLPWK